MKYLPDTNACLAALNGIPGSVADRFRQTPSKDIVLCSVVKFDLLYGAQKSRDTARNLGRLNEFFTAFASLKFDDGAAVRAATLRLDLERQGLSMGASDLLIAAIALNRNLRVVTHDAAFGRVPGLRVEDWET